MHETTAVFLGTDIGLDNVRLDTTSIEELNFLTKRLNSLERHEQIAYDAVTEKYFAKEGKELTSVKDLINLTYGLDAIPIVPDITNLEELGRFAVENSFITDLENLPDSALKFLNYEAIGKQQMENDEGFRIGICTATAFAMLASDSTQKRFSFSTSTTSSRRRTIRRLSLKTTAIFSTTLIRLSAYS